MTGSFKVQLVNMGTRAAAFQAKLRCLHDYHLRLLHTVGPPPSGNDIGHTIRYFSTTFLTILKDVPSSPHQIIKDPSQDHIRMSAYPNLEYGNLYNVLAMLLDVTPNIQVGIDVFGEAILQCLGCILPFLDKDLIDNIPYLTASCMSVMPPSQHQAIINSLCFNILPFTITRQSIFEEQECHSCQSVSAVIMIVFQFSDTSAHHCQLLECLMSLKRNVVKDLLCVIAYGTAASRSSAVKLLFYYWPAFNANLFDRRVLLGKYTNDLIPYTCQRQSCPNSGNAEATKVCYDLNISISNAKEYGVPPLYLCIECANEIHRVNENLTFGDLLHPMAQVSMICENKNCRSTEKSAVSICFSTECASYNGMHPIRYCAQCHSNRHNNRRGIDHIVHRSLELTWHMDAEMQTYMVESIISLLREAKPLKFEPTRDANEPRSHPYNMPLDNIGKEDRQLLGRYGIWLLVGRCTPTPHTPSEIMCRLLSMLFHWFHVTAYSDTGAVESMVEKLKSEHVCDWLRGLVKTHAKEFVLCLLPHPPEYARVGGHWDALASRTSHLKEGLQRIICLVPYEIITPEIWDTVMPHWMESITNDVPEKELYDLKIVLSKMLDPVMSPLGVEPNTMYNFLSIRFALTYTRVRLQALLWLQILSRLDITIPLSQLFPMFGEGVQVMREDVQAEEATAAERAAAGITTATSGGGGGGGVQQATASRPDVKSSVGPDTEPRRSSICMWRLRTMYGITLKDGVYHFVAPVVEDESDNTSAISEDEAAPAKTTDDHDPDHNLKCCVLMLDILLKQLELQDVERHAGINTDVCDSVCELLKSMVTAARLVVANHVCPKVDPDSLEILQVQTPTGVFDDFLKTNECASCEASVMWHQLSHRVVQYLCPENPVRPPDAPIVEVIEDEKAARKSPPDSDRNKERYRDVSLSMAPLPIPLGPLGFGGPVPVAVAANNPVHMPNICSTTERHDTDFAQFIHATDEIMTATVETVAEQLDVATMIPTESVVAALARSMTVSDSDVGTATVQVSAQPQLLGATTTYFEPIDPSVGGSAGRLAEPETTAINGSVGENGGDHGDSADDSNGGGGGNGGTDGDDAETEYWETSVGRFKNNLSSLPQSMQYIYQLLTELPTIVKPDTLYYILQCLNTLVLHGDVLSLAANQQRGFFLWLQENLLIQNLWDLCNAEYSHIAEGSVPLLLHCITLPLGSDVFWRIVQEAFHDSDWRVRFTAVERVTVITRFMDSTPLRSEVGLQTALATAFCHLVASMDDISVYVAQRATLYLGTIHDKAITSLLFCLESQFDLFIVDRPVVLQSLYQLHNSLSDRKVLSWDFFLNRFDTLFVEAQVNLEKSGDLACLRDLRNSDNGSEVLFTKISKAREALSQSDTFGGAAKTLSASFGPKWPYKRTMSAPASIIPRQESKIVFPPEKEKIYNRQTSAPILKRKSSRFGLGQLLANATTNNHSCSVSVPQSSASGPHQYAMQSLLQPLNCAPHGVLPATPTHATAPGCRQSMQYQARGPPTTQLLPVAVAVGPAGVAAGAAATPTTQRPTVLSAQQFQQLNEQYHHHGYLLNDGLMNMAAMFNVGAPDGNIFNVGVGAADEANLTNWLHRTIELEESDKETIHLLVFLFMQFLSRSDLAFPTEDKQVVKIQNIVLGHLYLLLGYSNIEKTFHVPSSQLRQSAVFNVFLSNLQQVLDQNHHMGWCMLPTVFQVLVYAPSLTTIPPNGAESTQNISYTFSLWQLEAHPRRNWLMSVLVIMYKYQYRQPPHSGHINNIIRVVLNSLDAHFHQCKRIPSTVMVDYLPPSRSRDVSQPSLGGIERGDDPDGMFSPPASPLFGGDGCSATYSVNGGSRSKVFTLKAGQSSGSRKYQDSSLDGDDTESELVAIPESDLSDSTINRSSAPESFDESCHVDEVATPMQPESYMSRSAHVTSMNLAQLAMSTLGVGEPMPEDLGKVLTTSAEPAGKTSSLFHKKSSTKCSLQEGVRMMVTPSMFMRGASPPRAMPEVATATTTTAATKGVASVNRVTADVATTVANEPPTNGAKATTKNKKKSVPDIKPFHFDVLDSPMSKMNVLTNPDPINLTDFLCTAPKVEELEIPTPERLLPIGPNEGGDFGALVSKVQEALDLPPIGAQIEQRAQEVLHDQKTHPTTLASSNRNSSSPRRLRKQVALDSPPNSHQLLDANSTVVRSVTHEFKPDPNKSTAAAGVAGGNGDIDAYATSQRQRLRKVGPFAVDSQSIPDSRMKFAGSWPPQRTADDADEDSEDADIPDVDDTFGAVGGTKTEETAGDGKGSAMGGAGPSPRVDEERLCDRCTECGVVSEEYNDEEIGLMVIIMATFIHREPSLAAPFLPEILSTVSKFATHCTFSWQYANTTHLPGGSQSVAHQFIRCVLHQLAPNGVFVQMFLTQGADKRRMKYFKSVAKALVDFPELNPASPVHMLVDTLNQKKTLPLDTLNTTLRNVGEYLSCVPLDVGIGSNSWSQLVQGIETLMRRLTMHLKDIERADYLLDIMVCVLKVPGVVKSVLDPFSKVLSHCVQTLPLKHKVLTDLCTISSRVFSKERDKHLLCRQLIIELVQALKFKTIMPDANLLLLVTIVLQDSGGILPPALRADLPATAEAMPLHTTYAADCVRQYVQDMLDFLADIHMLVRIKNAKSASPVPGLGEDTMGATLKGAIAQYLALEMSRGNTKDPKSLARYLPWLYNAPTTMQQQGVKEYAECVGHMRVLTWLLIGALTHSALATQRGGQMGQRGVTIHPHTQRLQAAVHHNVAQPVPQEASCHIAEHVQIIFAGYMDQHKSSVNTMSSLLNAFSLCLLWTIYLEQLALTSPATSEPHNVTMGVLFEFWAKITPSILQLASHSKPFAEMVNLHFIRMLEDLKETRSTVLVKLLPLWCPILSCRIQLSGTLYMRLQNCRDCHASSDEHEHDSAEKLLKLLQRMQFKLGSIEMQSSTATPFYSI